jgi:hypothetical protein
MTGGMLMAGGARGPAAPSNDAYLTDNERAAAKGPPSTGICNNTLGNMTAGGQLIQGNYSWENIKVCENRGGPRTVRPLVIQRTMMGSSNMLSAAPNLSYRLVARPRSGGVLTAWPQT